LWPSCSTNGPLVKPTRISFPSFHVQAPLFAGQPANEPGSAKTTTFVAPLTGTSSAFAKLTANRAAIIPVRATVLFMLFIFMPASVTGSRHVFRPEFLGFGRRSFAGFFDSGATIFTFRSFSRYTPSLAVRRHVGFGRVLRAALGQDALGVLDGLLVLRASLGPSGEEGHRRPLLSGPGTGGFK